MDKKHPIILSFKFFKGFSNELIDKIDDLIIDIDFATLYPHLYPQQVFLRELEKYQYFH